MLDWSDQRASKEVDTAAAVTAAAVDLRRRPNRETGRQRHRERHQPLFTRELVEGRRTTRARDENKTKQTRHRRRQSATMANRERNNESAVQKAFQALGLVVVPERKY